MSHGAGESTLQACPAELQRPDSGDAEKEAELGAFPHEEVFAVSASVPSGLRRHLTAA